MNAWNGMASLLMRVPTLMTTTTASRCYVWYVVLGVFICRQKRFAGENVRIQNSRCESTSWSSWLMLPHAWHTRIFDEKKKRVTLHIDSRHACRHISQHLRSTADRKWCVTKITLNSTWRTQSELCGGHSATLRVCISNIFFIVLSVDMWRNVHTIFSILRLSLSLSPPIASHQLMYEFEFVNSLATFIDRSHERGRRRHYRIFGRCSVKYVFER